MVASSSVSVSSSVVGAEIVKVLVVGSRVEEAVRFVVVSFPSDPHPFPAAQSSQTTNFPPDIPPSKPSRHWQSPRLHAPGADSLLEGQKLRVPPQHHAPASHELHPPPADP